MSLLRGWSLKRGSQSLAHAPRAALALLFLAHLLFSRLGARTPRPFVRNSSAPEKGRTNFDSNGGSFSGSFGHRTTEACAFEKAHPQLSALSVISSFRAFSFFSPLLYHQLVSCIRLRLSSSPARTHPDVRAHGRSASVPRRRRHCRGSPRNNDSSTFMNFISAPFPSLIFTSATRVRLGTTHTHQMKHGGASGVLQPGDSSSSGEEESEADEDTVLTEEEQAEEEECAAQSAIQELLEGEFAGTSDSLMSTSFQWLKLKDVLMRRMNNKEACAASVGSEPVCRVVPAEDSDGGAVGGRNLPCGGEKYERLIEKFLDERNCMAAMAMSHTLSQGWLGLPHTDEAAAATGGVSETSITTQTVGDKAEHTRALAAKGGLLGILVKQYEQVMESGELDSELSAVYTAAAQLLRDFKSAAVDGLNAFNSLELRDALLVRREQQVAILCSLGEGKKADLGSNVLATESALVVRVNTEGHDQATVKAFIDAVTAFGRFIKALLEEGGLADRAVDIHKEFYKFRFSKMQALMQSVEPDVLVHASNALLNALPLEKHKKHKHKKRKSSTGAGQEGTPGGDSGGEDMSSGGTGAASFPQLSASGAKDFLPVTFLQLVAEQNEAFKQQVTGFLDLENGTRQSRDDIPPSFLQSTAELQTSQLLPAPPYGTPPPSPPPQPVAGFVAQPTPVTVGPFPTPGAAMIVQGPAQPNQQPPVAVVTGPAQSPAVQQPFSGQVGQQQVAAGGSLGNVFTPVQPLLQTQVAMGTSQQQQQPQQLQQQQQQPQQLQQQQQLLDAVYAQPQLPQGQPMQLGQPVQQQGQQAQQQQGQPLQQQQQVGQPLQQPQQVGQPLQQPQQVGQPGQQPQQVGQPLQQPQHVGQPLQAPGQGMPQMQPHETAMGTKHFPQEGQTPQGGAPQSLGGGATKAEGEGGEGGKEASHVPQHQRQGAGVGHGDFSPRTFTEKGVPLRQKLTAVVSRLRMFKMQEDKVLFEADEALVDKIVRAGYHEMNDRVYIVWGTLLPQAAVTTAAELLTMLMPIPEVDLAMFYNKTLHDEGRITDGYSGPLPIDDKAIIDRFSRFVDETYSECWRFFFAKNDNLMEEPSPPPFSAQQPPASGSHPGASFSALQIGDGHLSLAAETEELTDYLHLTAQAAESLQQYRHHVSRKAGGDARGSVGGALAPASKQPMRFLESPSVLAQVQQHAKISLGGGNRAKQAKPKLSVTFVESSDGVSLEDLQKQFVNVGTVEQRTVNALKSGASRTLSWTMLPATASVAMALLSTIFLLEL